MEKWWQVPVNSVLHLMKPDVEMEEKLQRLYYWDLKVETHTQQMS